MHIYNDDTVTEIMNLDMFMCMHRYPVWKEQHKNNDLKLLYLSFMDTR